MGTLFRQFSFPGGVPSHVAPETPGSIHEGGELGYSLSHACGAAFDNPDLIVACVVGDGEAETGPLATSWHGGRFLEPGQRRRGAADPAPQRLQDRQPGAAGPHPGGRARRAAARVRIPAEARDRPASRCRYASEDGRRRWIDVPSRQIHDPSRSAPRRLGPQPDGSGAGGPVADDRAALAQGVDRPGGGGWAAGGGHLAGAPGAARRGADQPGAPAATGGMAALLPAGGAVRRRRGAPAGTARPGPGGSAAARRVAARERRRCCCGTWCCRTSATTRCPSPGPASGPSEPTRVLGGMLRDVMAAQR